MKVETKNSEAREGGERVGGEEKREKKEEKKIRRL